MRRRRGFTLVELLVVVAVLGALAALLLPVVANVRGAAMQVVCASRLRDLTLACDLYRTRHRDYPKLGPAAALPPPPLLDLLTPQDFDTPFLNALAPFLRFPVVPAGTPAFDLPPAVQCPWVEGVEAGRDRPLLLDLTRRAYYTGYGYYGRVTEGPAPLLPLSRVLRPDRVPSKKSRGRAVLWSDDVHYSLASGGAWGYSHAKPGAEPGPFPLTYADAAGLAGQHRAFTDGGVEWVPAGEMGLDASSPSLLDLSATLRVTPLYYCWF